MRINARLDPDRSRKLDFLLRITDQKISEIIKQAIDVYYERVRRARPKPGDILTATGFVGSAQAGPDLSSRYKERLGESLAAKHDHR